MTESKRVHVVLLLLLAGFLFFVQLGGLGLTDRDEGSNAEAAREMLESGDWITPTLNGEPRFAKPAFLYWLIGGTYHWLGVSEFTARMPSAVAGLLLILLHYGFMHRMQGASTALVSALMLLLNIEILAIGRLVLTDSVLILFTTMAIYGFWLGLHGQPEGSAGEHRRRRHFIWLFYLGMALGTLTKGPIGFAVPLLATIPYLTVTRRWGQFMRRGYPLAGMALFLLVALPWYATMLSIHGGRYTQSAQADTIGRFFNVIGGHGGTILFYVPVLLLGFFPWSGLLPAALWQALRLWRNMRNGSRTPGLPPGEAGHPPASRELEFFAALWLVSVFIFFSLSSTRLPHYIGPLFPAAALLTGIYWTRCLANPDTPGLRFSIRTMMGMGYVLGFAFAAAPELYGRFIGKIAKEFPAATQIGVGSSPVIVGVILLVGMAAVAYFGLSDKRRPGAFWAAATVITSMLLIGLFSILPRFNHFFIAPPQELAYTAGLNLGPNDRLILYGPPKPSFIFYAKRKVVMIKPGEELNMVPYLSGQGRNMILLPSRLREKLPSETRTYVPILERYGYLLLANKPMIDIPESPPRPKSTEIPPNPHGF